MKAIEINLLPWRARKRQEEKKRLYLAGFSLLLLIFVILLSAYCQANYLIKKKTQVNQRLEKEISLIDKQLQDIESLKKEGEKLIFRLKFVQKLRNNSILLIHFFAELVRFLPKEIYLSKLQKTGGKIIVKGVSETNRAVSQLIQNIEQNPWMQSPILIEIKKSKRKETNNFQLSFILKAKQEVKPSHD